MYGVSHEYMTPSVLVTSSLPCNGLMGRLRVGVDSHAADLFKNQELRQEMKVETLLYPPTFSPTAAKHYLVVGDSYVLHYVEWLTSWLGRGGKQPPVPRGYTYIWKNAAGISRDG
jgi:hypothetical protein